MKRRQTLAELIGANSAESRPMASSAHRPWWRFSLLGLFGLLSLIAVGLAVLSSLWRVPRAPDRMEISLRAEGTYVDEVPISPAELHRRLCEFRTQWCWWREQYAIADDSSAPASRRPRSATESPTICLRVEGAVRYWQFSDTIAHCVHAGLRRFEVHCQAGIIDFVDASTSPWSRPDDWPDFVITGRGDSQGRLVRIVGGSEFRGQGVQTVYTNAAALHADLLSLAGGDFGPDSRSATWSIAVECDDNLRFEHVSEMLVAATARTKSDGSMAPLFQSVHFLEVGERAIGWGGQADSDLTPDLFRHVRSAGVNRHEAADTSDHP